MTTMTPEQQQFIWEYEHGMYGQFTPDPNDEWDQLPARVEPNKIPELLSQIVDTTALEDKYALLEFMITYGILDLLMEKFPNYVSRLSPMTEDKRLLGEELKKLHERNHNIALAVGNGMVNKAGTAHASPLGISYSNPQGQHGYHHATTHGPIHGQPGMPYQQYPAQPPSLGKQALGVGLGMFGLKLPQGQQQPPPYPGYPPQPYPAYPP
jgi:hypothetical protein